MRNCLIDIRPITRKEDSIEALLKLVSKTTTKVLNWDPKMKWFSNLLHS
jgi:hypothetical protein